VAELVDANLACSPSVTNYVSGALIRPWGTNSTAVGNSGCVAQFLPKISIILLLARQFKLIVQLLGDCPISLNCRANYKMIEIFGKNTKWKAPNGGLPVCVPAYLNQSQPHLVCLMTPPSQPNKACLNVHSFVHMCICSSVHIKFFNFDTVWYVDRVGEWYMMLCHMTQS